MKMVLAGFLSFHAFAWPGIFAAVALGKGQGNHLLAFVAAGAVFGGLVLGACAGVLAAAHRWFARSRFTRSLQEAWPSPGRIALGGLIPLALGTAGLVCELFWRGPSFG